MLKLSVPMRSLKMWPQPPDKSKKGGEREWAANDEVGSDGGERGGGDGGVERRMRSGGRKGGES